MALPTASGAAEVSDDAGAPGGGLFDNVFARSSSVRFDPHAASTVNMMALAPRLSTFRRSSSDLVLSLLRYSCDGLANSCVQALLADGTNLEYDRLILVFSLKDLLQAATGIRRDLSTNQSSAHG